MENNGISVGVSVDLRSAGRKLDGNQWNIGGISVDLRSAGGRFWVLGGIPVTCAPRVGGLCVSVGWHRCNV